jgi:tetratricopeptide (TPR) repeat protein
MLRGALFYAMDQDANAWESLERAEPLRPGSALGELNRAILLRDVGRLGEALDQVNLAITQGSKEPALRTSILPLLVRSSVLFGMGDHESARKDWEEALCVNSREATIFSPDRVRIFARSWPWAQAFFAWLGTNAPERAIIPVAYAETALRAGEYQVAVEQFTTAMLQHASLRDLSYYRGLAHLGLGDDEKAREDFQQAEQVTRRAHIRRYAAAQLRKLAALPGN